MKRANKNESIQSQTNGYRGKKKTHQRLRILVRSNGRAGAVSPKAPLLIFI
jgi:hypothetical protein